MITHAPGEAGPIADVLFERPEVRAFNFTGSTAVGRLLAERAGATLKRIALELGGFNPTVVLADVNLDDAVQTAVFAAFFHQGQICMNTRKLIVERPVYDAFVDRFAAASAALRVGDPSDPASQLGPLIDAAAVAAAPASTTPWPAGRRSWSGGERGPALPAHRPCGRDQRRRDVLRGDVRPRGGHPTL